MIKKQIAVLLVLAEVLLLAGCALFQNAPQNTTAEPTSEPLRDNNGNVIPVYSDVELSSLDPSLFFVDENGRMQYNDPAVKVYTGIDVSVFQGEVDFSAVKADGIDFVMLRVGYRGYGEKGSLNEDENFRKNCESACAAGLKVGAYFFSQAISPEEAAEEAEYVLSIIKDYNITYPVAYDWEAIDYDEARTDGLDNEMITKCACAFCDKIAAAGYDTVVYFNRSLGYFSYDLSLVKNHYFWLAEYGGTPSFIYDFRIWQYTKTGSVSGITGDVDLNISITDFSEKESVG